VTPLKQWRSVDEQLDLLKRRGLQVEDDVAALNYLQRIGYYRLSGYWYPLRVIDEEVSRREHRPVRLDEFVPGSRFEDVVKLYVFDKKLRMLAMDALERIEMAMRVDVAYLLGEKDPCAHENPDCLHGRFTKQRISHGKDRGRTGHEVWLEKYQQLVERSRRLPFVSHHRQTYDGRLPIWVAIEVWDFGLLSRFFAGMRFDDQQVIADKYGARDGRTLAGWLRSMNFMRNVAAHHSRMWNINVLEVAPVPSGWPGMSNARPFFYFCLMQKLLRAICPHSTWGQRLRKLLKEEFPGLPRSAAPMEDVGLCEGWEEWNLWART